MKPFLLFFIPVILLVQPLFSQNTLDNAGLTSATPASVGFSLRKLSTSYAGPAIKVRRSSDNAEATVAFDGSGMVSASSPVSFTPGAAVGTALGTAQTGTISSDVGRTGTITVKAIKTGTITTSNGSLTVTGIGTNFSSELVVGDRIFNSTTNVFLGVVASITNNTTLLLTNYSTLSLGAIAYKTTSAVVTGTGTNFTGELTIGDRLFNTTNAYLGTVTTIVSATSLTLNGTDAVAATTVSYKGTTATITGTGTNFTGLNTGDLVISNNTTLGIISSISSATSLTLATKAGGCISGLAYKSATGTVAFSSFYAGTSVYVSAWYDQSGNGRDAFQLKSGNQARIVNTGTLYTVNGKTSMEFSNSLTSYLQTTAVASYLNNTLYTLNKVTAEATINPTLQLPISTTGGNGPNNTISHYGYRSSSQFTVAQYANDQNFNATPSTSLELHTAVKISTASSQFYKNGISLGVLSSGTPSNLSTVGILSIGFYTPTVSYYNGSISELLVFSTALASTDVTLLNNNQLAYYNIATTYWTGAVSTDWTNTGNWSTGIVPTIATPSIVVIPAGKPFYPIITGVSPANSISIEAAASLTVTGTLQLAGTINNLGTCTASAGTVQYMGTAAQGIAANTFAGSALQNMIINNGSGVSLNGNIAVTGNLTFTTGKLSLASSTLTIGGVVTNTIAGGLTGSSTSSLVLNGSVSPSLSFDQTTVGTTNSLKGLTINSSGQIVTLTNNLVLTGTTTFIAGKLAINSTTLTIRGLVVNTVNGGLRGSASGNLIVDGLVSPTLSFDQTTPGATNTLSSLTINCSGQTTSLNNILVIAGFLNITAGTLADGGNQLSSTGTLNLSSGTFKLGSPTVATAWPAFTTNTISPGGIVEYAAGVLQTVSAIPVYQNLTISATGGTVAANNLTVNGLLTLSAANPSSTSGSLSMSTYTLNMGPSSTTAGQGDVTGIVKRTTVLPNINYTMGNEFSFITFPNTGTLPSQISMKITIGATPSWQPGAIKRVYDFIQTGASGTKAVINAHYLDGELNGNVEGKLVDFSYRYTGAILTEHGKSNFNTTQNYVTLSNVNVAFFSSTFGNVELTLDESTLTTLTWNGSTSTSWITATNWTPNGGPSTNTDLIIPDAATTPNDPYLPATASNGSLTIESGGIVNADPGAQLTINNPGLAWSNAGGTFNAGSSTITFASANATINGVTNFNNVVIGSGATLQMVTGSVMRIGGTMTNNGTWSTGLLNNMVEYNGNNQTIINPNGSTLSYYSLVISGSGTSVLPAASLNILGDLTINGAIGVSGNTISMNGANPQSINGTAPIVLNNLTINNSSVALSLNQGLTVSGTLGFTAGKLSIGANTLALSGNVLNTVSNGLTGGPNSNLIVNGIVSPTLSFDKTNIGVSNTLNNLTINSIGQAPLLGSDLEVWGSLIFTAGKMAINGNTLTLKGPIVNTVTGGLKGSSASNLLLTGGTTSPVLSFDQTTTGTTNLLNNLSVNSSGQEAFLGNPLIVGGTLSLVNGLISTTSGNSLNLTAAAGITGGSDSSFVDGPLIRNTSGATAFAFPVGKINYSYRPASVMPVSATAGVYTAEYFPLQGPTGTYNAGLTGIVTNEYWDISRTSGPDAQVALNYTGNNTWSPGSPTTMDNIVVVHFNGGGWDPVYGTTLPGNTGNGTTPVNSKAMNSFSPFTFGFGPGTILPVTLIDFTAEATGAVVVLNWTTTDESALKSYEIERSANSRDFYKIGSVGAMNMAMTRTFDWTDNAPLEGSSFYRLKMVDIDRAFKYSGIVKVNRNGNRSISIYPNPVTGHTLYLQMVGQPNGDYLINLYNMSGNWAMSSRLTHDGSNTVRSMELNKSLPTGVYYVEITDPEKKMTTFKIFVL